MRLTGLRGAARATVAGVLVLTCVLAAQDVTEPALKAAYIIKFANFTEWPAEALAPSAPLVVCVLGDVSVGDALKKAAVGRVLEGHALAVSVAAAASPPSVCHILWLSGMTADQATKVVAGFRDAAVLTMSDLERFTEIGGIAQFFFEQGQLRFNVHRGSAERAHLRISSQVFQLSRPK